MPQNRQRVAGIAAGLIILLLLSLLIPRITSTASGDDTPDDPTPTEQCTSQVHFYANEAPAGSNQFGPALSDQSLEAGVSRFETKLCTDPAFTAAWEDVIVHNLAHGKPAWYELRATQFINDRAEWKKAVDTIKAAIDKTAVQDRQERYHTLLMVPRAGAVPIVRRTDRPVPMEHVLVFHLKDGRTEFARYVCDLQPARPEFPGVPPERVPVPEAPPVPPPPPPPPTPTTRPCPSGKCTPPVTVAPPPTTAPPATGPVGTTPENNSGPGAPPNGITPPSTVQQPATPPSTSTPPTSRVEY